MKEGVIPPWLPRGLSQGLGTPEGDWCKSPRGIAEDEPSGSKAAVGPWGAGQQEHLPPPSRAPEGHVAPSLSCSTDPPSTLPSAPNPFFFFSLSFSLNLFILGRKDKQEGQKEHLKQTPRKA